MEDQEKEHVHNLSKRPRSLFSSGNFSNFSFQAGTLATSSYCSGSFKTPEESSVQLIKIPYTRVVRLTGLCGIHAE